MGCAPRPIRRGGGHIFAKRPRDWTYRLPRKAVQLATRMALASKIRDGQITLIDELAFDAPKTKDMAAIIKALKALERFFENPQQVSAAGFVVTG